ncbi:hypothetical protein F4777DRAFT_580995 [Nemania sp. FL0916]|nr:hypothetical protein F4777DRAFT_580995 [Nemania sp. FL0916]
MSVPNYSVVPIAEADIPAIGGLLQDSKLCLAINRFLVKDWPNFAIQKPHYTKAVEGGMANPDTTCLKVVNDTSQLPVAHLFYTRKTVPPRDQSSTATETKSEDAKDEVPAGFIADPYWTVVKTVEELEPEFDTDEYMELTHVYVEPSSRGQGIGSWLFQIARDAATTAGLPFTICAEPDHHDFFVKRGFKDVKSVDIDLNKWAAPLSGYGVFRLARMVFVE